MIAACAYFLNSPIDWHKITAIPDLSVENDYLRRQVTNATWPPPKGGSS